MAFHVFAAERVDVAVVEVGLGGRHDATNILPRPFVCGVTSLGLDHTAILGDTIGEIGYQKGGIYKPGVPAVTSPQLPEGMASLSLSAKEAGVPLLLAPPAEEYGAGAVLPGVKGTHQLINASLALQLIRLWDARKAGSTDTTGIADGHAPGEVVKLPAFVPDAAVVDALRGVRWPGRSQKFEWSGFSWFLDGAHTSESCTACAEWFAEETASADGGGAATPLRVLLFNCTGGRDPSDLLAPIARIAPPSRIDVAVFCPGGSTTASRIPDQINLTVDDSTLPMRRSVECQAAWTSLRARVSSPEDNGTDDVAASSVFATLEECVDHIRALQAERGGVPVHVLVTGSLHFVGAVMHFSGIDVS
jgi:folylpolyglutamate synthase